MALRVLSTAALTAHLLTEGGRTTPAEAAGALSIDSNGKMYRYVKNKELALDNSDLCTFKDRAANEVTQDISAGNAEQPAGVYDQATQIATDEFFWLQVAGESQVNSETVSAIAVGDPLVPHATADGEVDEADQTSTTTLKASIGEIFAIAQAVEVAGTPDTVKCRLTGLV